MVAFLGCFAAQGAGVFTVGHGTVIHHTRNTADGIDIIGGEVDCTVVYTLVDIAVAAADDTAEVPLCMVFDLCNRTGKGTAGNGGVAGFSFFVLVFFVVETAYYTAERLSDDTAGEGVIA